MLRSQEVRLAVFVVAIGCWHAPVADEQQPTVPLERDRSYHTVWEGSYLCAQGETALRLTLDTEPDGQTVGSFDFGPHPGNPNIPSGSYRVRGKVTMRDTGAFDLVLVPDHWIVQPNNYMMVGLTATSDRERRNVTGRITHDSCDWARAARLAH
jgi:hypothetical protein